MLESFSKSVVSRKTSVFAAVDSCSEIIFVKNIIDDTLFINTIEDQFGGPVIATVTSDDQISSTSVSDNFEIMVAGINDAPTLSTIDNQEIDELVYHL